MKNRNYLLKKGNIWNSQIAEKFFQYCEIYIKKKKRLVKIKCHWHSKCKKKYISTFTSLIITKLHYFCQAQSNQFLKNLNNMTRKKCCYFLKRY